MLCWLCVADKSSGQVWYVNMCATLEGYSQLLLQDLRRDLMLISKKTESCRLSMVSHKKRGFTTRHKYYKSSPSSMSKTPSIPTFFSSSDNNNFLYASHTSVVSTEYYPPQVLVKDIILNDSVNSCSLKWSNWPQLVSFFAPPS